MFQHVPSGLLAALSLLPALPVAADPWLGVASPETVREQRETRARAKFVEVGVMHLAASQLKAGEQYAGIRAEDLMQSVRDIVAFSEQSRAAGDRLWGRISGGPYERKTAEYVAARFREYGLTEVRLESFPRAPQFWPLSWDVSLLADTAYGADTQDYRFELAFPAEPSAATSEAGIEAELVHVGSGRAADLTSRELKGKIAVVRSQLQPSAFAHSAVGVAERLAKLGAVAVITVMDVPAQVQYLPYGAGSAAIPCFTLNGDDGRFLEEVIARSASLKPARMRLSLRMELKTGLTAQNVLGFIPGSSEEAVMLTAHMDAFFYGANDNASGLAVMLALARHYSLKDAPKPRRTLVFVGTSGHHVHDDKGAYSAGVSDLIVRHKDLLKRTAFVYNAEHIGARRVELQRDFTTGNPLWITTNQGNPFLVSVSNRSPKLLELLNGAMGRYGIPALTQTNHFPFGDPSPFFFAGVPVVNLISSGLTYHSTADTPESLSPEALERFARASADFLDQVDVTAAEDLEKGTKNQKGTQKK